MSLILDPFKDSNAFNASTLTKAINVLPNMYGLVNGMDLFPVESVSTTSITIEYNQGTLQLLQTGERGAVGTALTNEKRRVKSFEIPHIPHTGSISPRDIQNLTAFGSTSLETVSNFMVKKLATMRNNQAITLENLRVGALKGKINDADGTLIYDLFDEFNVQQQVFDFKLSDPNFEVREQCMAIQLHIDENLLGEVMKNVCVIVSPEFFSALVGHKEVKAAYDRFNDGQALRDSLQYAPFQYGGLKFIQYNARVPSFDAQGKSITRRFIDENEGHAFPEGTMDTFRTYAAPAELMQTVNKPGELFTAWNVERANGTGWDLYCESNPLPMCSRPNVLVKVVAS